MSYDIRLVDPVTRATLELDQPHMMQGSRCVVGGTSECELTVTYNYSSHFRRTLGDEGIRSIYGLSGAASIYFLNNAIDMLGDDVDDNYWTPTEGNAKRALCQLRAFAYLRPDGIWDGD